MKKFIINHKNFLIIIFSLLLAYIFSPLGGMIHKSIFGIHDCFFWGHCDSGDHFEGFVHFFVGFFIVFSFYFLDHRKAVRNLLVWFVLNVLISAILGYFEGIILNILFSLVAWILANIGLILAKKLKNK